MKSPQATFTNYHKQDFLLLAQTSVCRDKKSFFHLRSAFFNQDIISYIKNHNKDNTQTNTITMHSTSTLQKAQTKRDIISIQRSILHLMKPKLK